MSLEIHPRNRSDRPANLEDYVTAFSNEAISPPGGDRYMKAFYTALVSVTESHQPTQEFLKGIVEKRLLTPQHFTNLIFRVTQYIQLFKKQNPDYPLSYDEPNKWKEEIPQLIGQYRGLMSEMLLTKDTTTTIYQRYAGTAIVLNAFFPHKELSIADFGCGANYGLPGLVQQVPFKEIDDQTTDKRVTQLLIRQPQIKEGLSIDKVNPNDSMGKKWRIACSFYPNELDQRAELAAFEKKIEDVEAVKFLQADLLELRNNHEDGTLPYQYFDAVIMNSICYQLYPEEQKIIFETAKKSLKPDGIFIVQDFAKRDVDPKSLYFVPNWFAGPFLYRTFINGEFTSGKFKEFLQWFNGRCTRVRAGEDFEKLANSQPAR